MKSFVDHSLPLVRRSLSLLTLALLLFATACSSDDDIAEAWALQEGDTMPSFTLTDFSGTTRTVPDAEGRPGVVVFFSTTCPDCQQQLPVIQQIYEKYGETISLLCINRSETAQTVRSFWQTNQYTMPVYADGTRTYYELFANRTVPRVYFYSGNLIVHATTDDPLLTFSEADTWLQTLLGNNGK